MANNGVFVKSVVYLADRLYIFVRPGSLFSYG